MYLGGNLSSVGCDIRPYFVPIITQRIIDITDHTVYILFTYFMYIVANIIIIISSQSTRSSTLVYTIIKLNNYTNSSIW